jgi:hypothetical protein
MILGTFNISSEHSSYIGGPVNMSWEHVNMSWELVTMFWKLVTMSWESPTLSIEPRIIPRYTFNMLRDILA